MFGDIDELIFEEKSEAFTVGIGLSSDEKYFFITTSDHNSSEQHYFPVNEKNPKPKLIKQRKDSLTIYKEQNRSDLAIKEEEEIRLKEEKDAKAECRSLYRERCPITSGDCYRGFSDYFKPTHWIGTGCVGKPKLPGHTCKGEPVTTAAPETPETTVPLFSASPYAGYEGENSGDHQHKGYYPPI